jgi:putative PIN family toxin of toxin-antitoxin system
MRVLLDSNVLVAAFATQGICHAVFELCLERHQMIVSRQLLEEIKGALIRKLKMPERLADERLHFLMAVSSLEQTGPKADVRCRDPEDLHVLSLGINSGAKCIVSGDKDLLELKKVRGIQILSPRKFWELERNSAK